MKRNNPASCDPYRPRDGSFSGFSRETSQKLKRDLLAYHEREEERLFAQIYPPSVTPAQVAEGLMPDDLEGRVDQVHLEDLPTKSASTRSAVFWLMVLSAFTKIFGFLREVILARFFGVGEVAGAYRIAQTIPVIILMVVGTGLAVGFIPTYNKTLSEKGEKAAHRFMSNTITVSAVLGILFCLIVAIFPNFFVWVFASGFTPAQQELTAWFTKVAVWGVVFSIVNYILQPYLQMHDNFWVPAMVGIPMNLVFLISFPMGAHWDLKWLPIGVVVAGLVQTVWLIPFVKRKNYSWRPTFDLKDSDLRHLLMLAGPVIFGVAVNQINIIVDRNMASQVMREAGVSALGYANQLNGFVQGIFIYSVITVIFPRLSRMVIEKDYEGIETQTTNAMVTMALVVLPCIVGLMVFADPIIRLLFQRGKFDEVAVSLTSGGVFYYAIGLIGFAFREVLARVFYAMNNTKTPTINAAIAVGINIVLNIVLAQIMGLNGLPLATSLSALIGAVLLMIALKKEGSLQIHYRSLLGKGLKIGAASLIMGGGAYALYALMLPRIGPKLGVLMAIVAAAVLYTVAILMMRIPEVEDLLGMMRSRLGRKR
ncbi:putative peptidoglycan lipid II flippase MurJ [Clostridiaceae bacterium JG1575]|nr:putative peptidoglycan lipid II flippase MurJ [Clostridiaceae bacterium JG1575]